MSTSQAIAGVTVMLDFLITEGILQELGSGGIGTVTTKPLDEARKDDNSNQINIFLYQTLPNSAWRNMNMPKKVKPGETGKPALALNLYYLITAYEKTNDTNDQLQDQKLLGIAMRVLHDHPLIRSQDIERAIRNESGLLEQSQIDMLKNSNLENQIERIAITPTTLSLEDLSRLWGTFQTGYRLSAAYEVSVVLIESKRPVKTPLPVLMIGSDDKGIIAQTGLIPPVPGLTAIKLPKNQYYFTVGNDLILEGHNLNSENGENGVEVHCQHPLTDPIVLTPIAATDQQIMVTLNGNPHQWRSGFYTVTVKVVQEGRDRVTNALTFPLVPEVTIPDREITNELTLTCNPPVQREQLIALLLGSQEIPYQFTEEAENLPLPEESGPQSELTFNVSNVTPGEYVVRLRVDGVDSVPIDFTQQPPIFKEDQKVTIS
ncbi:MAG: DUF4255 domain-containing protein [Hormoscilla sp. GM102CHS1]|nr:DUF4255 domain-containing protein [Hormoscilla sp. GM102CHS1]